MKKNIRKIYKIYILIGLIIVSLFINSSVIWVNGVIFCGALIPLAILLGQFTNAMSDYIGEKKGGLLAATVGNLPELIMGIWAIKYGMILMAKSALMGCIICNMLLGLGIAIIYGGVKFNEQRFNKIIARTNFNMLILAFAALVVMTTINRYGILQNSVRVGISVKVAFVLIGIYILGLVFSLYTHRNLFVISEEKTEHKVVLDKKFVFIVINLILVSVLIYFVSERLIFNLKIIAENYRITEEFLGVIVIPPLGNIGEMASAIISAGKNKINLSLETSIGSSIQMALFVTPSLVICSYFMGIEMTLFFSVFQMIMTAIAVGMSYVVFQDGRAYWFEGAILIAIYIIIIIGYYYLN